MRVVLLLAAVLGATGIGVARAGWISTLVSLDAHSKATDAMTRIMSLEEIVRRQGTQLDDLNKRLTALEVKRGRQ